MYYYRLPELYLQTSGELYLIDNSQRQIRSQYIYGNTIVVREITHEQWCISEGGIAFFACILVAW